MKAPPPEHQPDHFDTHWCGTCAANAEHPFHVTEWARAACTKCLLLQIEAGMIEVRER